MLRVAGIADSGAVVWFGALLLLVINLPNTPKLSLYSNVPSTGDCVTIAKLDARFPLTPPPTSPQVATGVVILCRTQIN